MAGRLDGKRVAILATNGVEEVELKQPRKALQQAGAETQVVSPVERDIRAWRHDQWGDTIPVDLPLTRADADEFDALLIPGGVMSPDKLRMNDDAVSFVRAFFDQDKPVASICHGPWLLAEAGVVRGREITSWPSLETDLENAGGNWVDREVVVDGRLVTSRKPDDIPAFNDRMVQVFAEAPKGARQGSTSGHGS
jgi:protease I